MFLKITSGLISPGTWLNALYTAYRSNSGGTPPNFWRKTRRYVQKWHLRYKTSDISEWTQSRFKLTTDCLWELVYGLSIGERDL